MTINRNNYETFFIDYFDGNLNDNEIRMLFSFLNQYPDLKAEFDAFEMHTLTPDEEVNYNDKSILKKPTVDLYNYQTFLIANIENDLDANAKQQLDAFIEKNPYVQFETALFNKTQLHAGTEVFTNKKSLKKPVVIPFYVQYKYPLAVAAAIALLVLFSQVFFVSNNSDQQFATDKSNTAIQQTTQQNKVNTTEAAVMANKENTFIQETNQIVTEPAHNAAVLDLNKVAIKEALELKTVQNKLPSVSGSIIPGAYAFLELKQGYEEDTNTELYASVVNEVNNPEVQTRLSHLTNNTLQKLSSNKVSMNSIKTQSGLLKSWKLQAGNFSITHTKN